ncbi:MAG: double zinc ribbon domain-containing protein [Treponema sp.]|jgi:ComF family protein|nr:double zinc ribbon domain-containing protein [Treponema sp.]
MKYLIKILLLVKNFLFPSRCALCETLLTETAEIREGLCEKCMVSLVTVQGEKCKLCGKPLISERDICLSCRNQGAKACDRLWVIFPYTGVYRKLLHAYKFAKNLALAVFFAGKALEVIAENPVLQDAVIVPVPPRPGKIKETGWDQVDYLAKHILKQSCSAVVQRCLKRRRSKAQKQLDRKGRMENMKGRVYLREKPPKTVLVIDDVITTGSTLEVCSDILKKGGAEKVYGLCLFYD